MEDKNKFNLKYLFTGDPVNPVKDWYKAIGYGWRIGAIGLVLVLIIFTIWKAFFEKKNLQQTHIGQVKGDVNITQNVKKTLIPFIEGYVFHEGDKDRLNFGIKTGLRVEF
jgi:hypothetical protein